MATATLAHGYDPALVGRHLGISVTFTTRRNDYLFDVDVPQATLDAAVQAVQSATPVPRRVPESVDAHKFKIALRRNGFRAAFDTYLTAAGANEKDFWTSAPTIKRTSRYLDSLKTALSLTNAQVRALLIAADDEQD